MFQNKDKLSANHLKNYQHPDHFGISLGYQVKQADLKEKWVETELIIREDHLSPSGKVHGGVISAFVDFTCGAAVFTTLNPNDYCSTVELKINYLLPIELEDKLIAKAQVVFRGKRLCVLQCFIYRNGEKEPVTMATATFNITEKEQKML